MSKVNGLAFILTRNDFAWNPDNVKPPFTLAIIYVYMDDANVKHVIITALFGKVNGNIWNPSSFELVARLAHWLKPCNHAGFSSLQTSNMIDLIPDMFVLLYPMKMFRNN